MVTTTRNRNHDPDHQRAGGAGTDVRRAIGEGGCVMRKQMVFEQLSEAVRKVRAEASEQTDFDRGMQAGASAVAHTFHEIQRRDAALKDEGIKRGSQ